MKSIVIPVKPDKHKTFKELTYTLRSLEINLKYHGDIIVVGDKISSLRGLNYVRCVDDKQSMWKERNIYRKILKAIEDPRVTDDFVMLNDDHILTRPFDIDNLPYYYKSTLEQTMENNRGDYRKSVNHTRKYLMSHDKPTIDFDTHFPIVYNKQKFIDTFVRNDINWNKPFGYIIKSLYCGMNDIQGEFGGDCKIQRKMTYEEIKNKVGNKSFFSTADGVLNTDMIKYLNELYPSKSFYER